MSIFKKDESAEDIESRINMILQEMDNYAPISEEYQQMLTSLERLHEIKTNSRRNRISPDTLVIVGGNLLGILLIVAYEQKHVINTKGFGQLIRPK